jgi:hypothetical protein
VTISTVYNWTNFNGLVSFTNLATSSGTTFINGGNIDTDTITVNSLQSNTSGVYNNTTFGLGTNQSIAGVTAGSVFFSSTSSVFPLITFNTAGGQGFGVGTTNTDGTANAGNFIGGASISGVNANTWYTGASLGNGSVAAGIFANGGANHLQTSVAAQINLGYYTGGVAYAAYTVAGAIGPFTAGHDGLQLLTENIPQVGDVLVDVQTIAAPDVNDTISQVTVCTEANQQTVIGVFTGVMPTTFIPAALGEYVPNSNPELPQQFVLAPQWANIYQTYRPVAFNAIGEGMVNVCGLGGNISNGDLITTSTMAGKGMKQSDNIIRSCTLGKARQDVIFDTPDQVKMIACIYVSG